MTTNNPGSTSLSHCVPLTSEVTTRDVDDVKEEKTEVKANQTFDAKEENTSSVILPLLSSSGAVLVLLAFTVGLILFRKRRQNSREVKYIFILENRHDIVFTTVHI